MKQLSMLITAVYNFPFSFEYSATQTNFHPLISKNMMFRENFWMIRFHNHVS